MIESGKGKEGNMAVKDILTYPNEILADKSTDVVEVTDEILVVIQDMLDTMYHAPGIGLAAPQIGVLKNIIVVDVPEEIESDEGEPEYKSNLIVLVNPDIESKEGDICIEEGCLSVPDLLVKVKRAREIVVCGLDHKGDEIKVNCSGMVAIAIQHEIDHLNGILITDHASHLKRSLYAKKIKKRGKAKKL